MSTNYDRQAKLAESAPLPELQALSKGANPRLVQPFVALGALNARMAQMQSDKMLQGAAAPGSMPTLKDKIEQSIAQMKAAALARQQAAQSPGMFQVPEGTPEPQVQPQAPEQMYNGGVAHLPVNDRMFGYANGGIIAFNGEEQSDVPEGLTREEAEAIRRRMKQRTDMTPEKMDVTDLDFTSLPQLEKSNVLAKALASIPKEEPESEMMRAVKTPFRALGEGIKSLYKSAPGTEPTPIGAADQNLGAEIIKAVEERKPPTQKVTVEPAPTGKPELQKPRVIVDEKTAAEQARLAALHEKFKAGEPPAGGIKTLPEVKPPGAKPPVMAAPAKEAAPTQDQESKMMDLLMKQFGPQPAVETTEQRLAARDKYVNAAPDSVEAVALLKHFDTMAKRYAANDQAEEAQKAKNAYNNLATFLINTQGSSLAAGGKKANAELQPLLAAQETRRQNYQKQRDEQEMLLGKARYEVRNAERARKEGRYADAEKSEMEAKKLQEQARGHNIQGLGSLINAAGAREERKLGREQQYLMHRERMEELGQQRERMREDSNRIKDAAERTQRENAYTRASAKNKEAIAKAQKMLDLPDLPKEMKQRAEDALARLTKEDNDMYERIVVRGDKDYRPQASGATANSALMSKADKIVGGK